MPAYHSTTHAVCPLRANDLLMVLSLICHHGTLVIHKERKKTSSGNFMLIEIQIKFKKSLSLSLSLSLFLSFFLSFCLSFFFFFLSLSLFLSLSIIHLLEVLRLDQKFVTTLSNREIDFHYCDKKCVGLCSCFNEFLSRFTKSLFSTEEQAFIAPSKGLCATKPLHSKIS